MVRILLYLFLFVLFFSCKKEITDQQTPIISILKPLSNQNFTAFDTIPIQGIITDNNKITSIVISLRNSNNINALNIISISPNTTSYNLNEQFLLNDLYLPSGEYNLKISAFDGVNQTDTYIPLTINEFPKSRNGFFIFSNSGSTTQITKLDNGLNSTPFTNIAGDFLNGGVNSLNQQVYSCGNAVGNLVALDANSSSQSWIENNNTSGFPYFMAISSHESEVYVGFYNRNIKSYTKNGVSKFSAQAFVNSYSSLFLVHENNLLITEQPEISTGVTRLVTYYLTGFVKDNILLNEDVNAMFSFSTNEVVLFTNVSGNGKLSIYNISSNSTWQPFALNAGQISSCTEVSTGIYLIAQNGIVNLVNMNNFTNSTYLSGVNAQLVKYDVITNEVIVSNGNSLTVYDYATKNVKGNYTHSNTILAFDFWYNK
ncbi:MAG: hypothetical protein HYU68_12885 [Bacteroidetes bacterium]|nr:hypothetical protein [Bacteroidota bacterium]